MRYQAQTFIKPVQVDLLALSSPLLSSPVQGRACLCPGSSRKKMTDTPTILDEAPFMAAQVKRREKE